MNAIEKHIVNSYSELLENLSFTSKVELIETLSKSLKTEDKTKEDDFYKAFGAFGSNESAEEIIAGIKKSRKFRDKEINF